MKLLNGIQVLKNALLNRRPNRRTQRTPVAPRSAEVFEARQLMAAAMATAVVAQAANGTVTNSQPKDYVIDAGKFANDGKADTIEARQNGDQVEIYVNGQLTQTLSREQIRSLTLKGSKDNDRLDASGI